MLIDRVAIIMIDYNNGQNRFNKQKQYFSVGGKCGKDSFTV